LIPFDFLRKLITMYVIVDLMDRKAVTSVILTLAEARKTIAEIRIACPLHLFAIYYLFLEGE